MWRVECFAVDNAPASQAKSDVKFFVFEAAAVEVRAHRVPFDEAPLICDRHSQSSSCHFCPSFSIFAATSTIPVQGSESFLETTLKFMKVA